ncbi:HEAT repeat domain-containing protein [Isosphaeraceae bacterium EP7]
MLASRAAGLVVLGLFLSAQARSADVQPLPAVAEGWKIELIEQAPQILYPTAVVAAPDGTVYLGQDPMDMPGPPTQPIDSVVAIKGGKVRLFADGLWSVMGLEWLDNTLYVVHAPFLSAFKDTDGDGKADQRIDLVKGLGPRLPGFSGINDHVASGIRLGIDGYLYIAVGDKGIPKATGTDGATIQLKGGGVVRVRPDGTGLEVVSTGERNPLSVALTATNDIFTYGNDDDSKKWPNSLTHHVVGGHYGYPYEFLSTPWRNLPIVAGQLGGSGAQGVCYNEAGLPAAYRGNLFFADWGVQTVFRYEIEKTGGTFTVKSKTPLVTKGELADFRPFSMAVAEDGRGFYLVDWAYAGWLSADVKSGRLYKLTYTGSDAPSAVATPADDLAALGHPALSVRLKAQGKLAGSKSVAPLIKLLFSDKPATDRIHALWSLDAIGTPDARSAARAALVDTSPEVRLQAARSAGNRRDRGAVPSLIKLLKDPDPAIRGEAAIALGRTGDPAAIPALFAALSEPDTTAGWSIRGALRSLKTWDSAPLKDALLDPKRRDQAILLADELWTLPAVEGLAAALVLSKDAPFRDKIVRTLAGLYRTYPAWTGAWFGTNPLAGEFPAKTVNWDTRAMTAVIKGLALGIEDPDPAVRRSAIAGLALTGSDGLLPLRGRLARETDDANLAALVGALGALADRSSLPVLAKLLNDPRRSLPVRASALDALASLPDRAASNARMTLLFDEAAPAVLRAKALDGLGRQGLLPGNDVLSFITSDEVPLRASALVVLAAVRKKPPGTSEVIVERLADPDPLVRRAAIEASAQARIRDAIPGLLKLSKGPERSEALLALSIMPDPRAIPLFLDALADRDPRLRLAAEGALAAVRETSLDQIEAAARGGTLPPTASQAVDRLLLRFRPIVDWRVIGPFARTTAQVFIGEPSIDFAHHHSGVEGRDIAWQARAGDPATGRVLIDDFKAGAGDKGGFGYDTNGSPDLASFAYAEIESTSERPAILRIGSSGSLIVTLNERPAFNYNNFAGRPYSPGSDSVRVDLKRGKNRLLMRTRQGIGPWAFSVQLSDPSDRLLASAGAGTTPAERLRSFALSNPGDAKKGEAIFFEPKGIGCLKCHAAAGKGTANFGPDLTGLAAKYDKAEIIRSVLEPSARIATGYQPVVLALADGQVLSGLVRAETDTNLEISDAEARIHTLPKSTIEERRVGDVSIMPAGLADTLTAVEFADLVEYLLSLKAPPAAAH